jgi:hypothetical protein
MATNIGAYDHTAFFTDKRIDEYAGASCARPGWRGNGRLSPWGFSEIEIEFQNARMARSPRKKSLTKFRVYGIMILRAENAMMSGSPEYFCRQ